MFSKASLCSEAQHNYKKYRARAKKSSIPARGRNGEYIEGIFWIGFDNDKAQQAIARQMSIGVNIDQVEMGLSCHSMILH